MTITGSINLQSTLSQTAPASIPGGSPLKTVVNEKFVPVAGTSGDPDTVDLKVSKTYTLTATPTVIDLTNLFDVFGQAVNFARVRSILIVNRDTTDTHDLKVGYSSTTSNAWTSWLSNPGQVKVGASTAKNSGVLFVACPSETGWAVTSSNKLLNLDPGANTIVVTVEITGCSA